MNFVEDGGANPPVNPPVNFSDSSSSNEEPVSISLRGSRKAVMRMIHLLHCTNIIAGSEWSCPIAIQKSGEVIRVASRMIKTDDQNGA